MGKIFKLTGDDPLVINNFVPITTNVFKRAISSQTEYKIKI